MDLASFPGDGLYQIVARGHLEERWGRWFEGLTIEKGYATDGTPITSFTGRLVDQAALHGVLAKIRDINIPLISVNLVKADS